MILFDLFFLLKEVELKGINQGQNTLNSKNKKNE